MEYQLEDKSIKVPHDTWEELLRLHYKTRIARKYLVQMGVKLLIQEYKKKGKL